MAEGSGVMQTMATLGLDYSQAIQSTQQMISEMSNLNAQLAKLKQTAAESAKSVNSSFSQMGGTEKSSAGMLRNQQSITKEYERQAVSIKQSTLEQIRAEATTLRQKAHTNRLGDDYKRQTQSIRDQVEAMILQLSIAGRLSDKEAEITAEFQEQLKIIRAQMTTDIADKPTGYFGSEMGRRVGWFLSGTAFYGSLKAAKDAITAIKDVEFSMVEIGRVMEDATFQTESYRDSLLQLGVEYGQSFQNVHDIALRWAQSGYNVADSLELTRTSLLALNTAELDAKNATEAMIGIMSQWQLQAGDLELVMDKINKTADNYTLTSQDLVDGLLRSSGAARVMNMSIDETIALLTVMREASGRTGREVGNALSSILSYLQRPKAISVMEALGIDVFADEARTQFRGAMEIFQDIERNWDTASNAIKDGFIEAAEDAGLLNEELTEAIGLTETWTDVQKRDLAQGAAGVFRRNYFIALIERLSNAQGVLNGLMTAGGYSQAENARTMDSLEKKVESLKTSVTQLAVALGDAGLLETLKSLADGMGTVVGGFNKLPAGMRDFTIIALSTIATVKTLDLAMKLLGIDTVPNVSTAIASLTKVVTGLIAGQTTLTAVTTTATVATQKFIAANWPLLALAAAVGVIYALSNAYKKYREEVDAAADVARQNIGTLDSEIATLTRLKNEYDSLIPQTEDSVDARRELLAIQKELADMYPSLITGMDEEGNGIADNIDKVEELTEAKRQQRLMELEILNDIAERELPRLRKELAEADAEFERLTKQREWFKNWLDEHPEGAGYANRKIDETTDAIVKQVAARKDLVDEIEKHENIEQKYAQIADATVKAFIAGGGAIDKYRKALGDLAGTSSDVTSEIASLNQAIYDAKEGKSLTAQEALNMIDKYNLTADAITQTTDGYKIEISTLVALREQKLNTTLSNIESAKADAVAERDRLTNNLQGYGLEVEALKTLAGAKLALARAEMATGGYGRIRRPGEAPSQAAQQTKAELAALVDAFEKLEQLDTQAGMLKGILSDPTFGVKGGGGGGGASKAMSDRLKLSTEWISYQKSIGQLTLQEEIAAWMRVLSGQSDNIEAVKTATTNLYKLRQQLADEDAQLQEKHIKHLTTLGVFSTQEQIDAYREMYKVRAATLADEQSRVENLFSLYKQLLSEQQALLKKAYDERIQMINDEAARQKETLRERIAGLKEELDLLGRKDKERSYEQTIVGIEEELAYWRVRVSEEARKKVIELEQKLDEEKYKKELDDQKQAIKDKIDALENEVKDVDKIAEEERKKWEKSYKKVEGSFNDHSANMVALAASMSKDSYQQWLDNYFTPLQNALSTGSFGTFDSLSGGGFGSFEIQHDWGMSETDYRRFLDNGARWHELSDQGYTSATSIEMRNLNEENDRLRRKYGRDVSLGEYPKFHSGAKTLSYGLARFKPGELVFPPNLSDKLETLIAILGHQNFGKHAVGGDKSVKIGTLLNIERNIVEDDADLTILVREIARAVQRI